MTAREFGAKGEYLARRFLETKGYVFIRANYFTKDGEIDLVMQENDEIVFVEVKTRTPSSVSLFGRGADAITMEKRMKIRKAARRFLREETRLTKDLTPRFDALELYLEEEGTKKIRVLHTPCAF